MDLIFDNNSRAVLEALGYKYFCTKEDWTAAADNEPSIIYWQLIPFVTQFEAFDYYFEHQKIGMRCHVFIDEEVIDELSQGIPGLVIRIRAVENVLC